MSEWMKRIIESKRAARREFAAQPYAEKLRIVERLRDAAELFRASRPANPVNPVRPARG
jgi:hypothetical protein